MEKIIILTTTYNRIDTLPKLYHSLTIQNNQNFEWVIIDDGSADGTKNYVDQVIKEKKIKIKYIYQSNGGKARALNNAFRLIKEDSLLVVVDSDDYLLPSATEEIKGYLEKYSSNSIVGAFFFHYQFPDGSLLNPRGKYINKDELLTRFEYNKKYKLNDGCICYFSRITKKYKYPEFENENYVGPTVIQMDMAEDYKILFSKKVIGVAEYKNEGLTISGRKLRMNNPQGMIYYSKLMMSEKASFFTRFKYAISMWPYANEVGMSFTEILKIGNRPILMGFSYLPGKYLTYKWKKYKD